MGRSNTPSLSVVLGEEPASRAGPRPRRRIPTLPLLLSAVIHGLIVVAAGFVVWKTAIAPGAGGSPGAGVMFETGMEPVPQVAPPGAKSTSGQRPIGSAFEVSGPTSAGSLEPLISASEAEAPLTGLSTGAGAPPLPSAISPLAGSSLMTGSLFGSSVGATSAGATPGAAAGSPSVTFGGLGASSVSSVVYVVDCSGPMVTSLPMVIAELERSVARLAASQRFGVVLFRRTSDNGTGAESFAPVLVRATPTAKELLHNWLAAAEPAGRSSPLAGVELALSLKPDAVFLLSRSIQRSGGGVWELGLDATMARLEQLNPPRAGVLGSGRAVLIQTIQFLDEDTTGIMQAIGTRHGGGAGYRVVKHQQDLVSPAPLVP